MLIHQALQDRAHPRFSTGFPAFPSGIIASERWQRKKTPYSNQSRAELVANMQHRSHLRHPHNRTGRLILHPLHPVRCQRDLPPSGRGNGSHHGVDGPRHHPYLGEVSQWHHGVLTLYHSQETHRQPFCTHVLMQQLRAHYDSAQQRLAPYGADGPCWNFLKGASRGLVQDWYGLRNINIYFLSHSRLLLAL